MSSTTTRDTVYVVDMSASVPIQTKDNQRDKCVRAARVYIINEKKLR